MTLRTLLRPLALVAVVATLALGAAGCGGDDETSLPSVPTTASPSDGFLNPASARTGTEWYLLYMTSLEDPAAKVQPFATADRKVFEAVGTVIGEFCAAAEGSTARSGPALVDGITAATGTVLGAAAADAAKPKLTENSELLVSAAEATCAAG